MPDRYVMTLLVTTVALCSLTFNSYASSSPNTSIPPSSNLDNKKQSISYVGKLISGKKSCTATLISANLLLSSAHCLFNNKTNKFISPNEIQFYSDYKEGSYQGKSGASTYTVGFKGFAEKSYTDQALHGDWAVITLKKSLGCELGHANIDHSVQINPSSSLMIVGYNQEFPKIQSRIDSCQFALPFNEKKSVRLKECILTHGLSGAPLFSTENSKGGTKNVIAVVSGGANDSKGRFRVVAAPVKSLQRYIKKNQCDQHK